MNFQQLQVVHEIAKRNFSLREAAAALFYSQNNVRKHIKDFEGELGIQIFDRRGKTIAGFTPAGRDVLEVIDRIQTNIQKLKSIARSTIHPCQSCLRIGSTRAEAGYFLPSMLCLFKTRFPDLDVQIHIAALAEIKDRLSRAELDLGIGPDFAEPTADLTTLKGWEWPLVIVLPEGHPLTLIKRVTLEALAAFPIVTYHQGVHGRRQIDAAFAKAGLKADVVLAAETDDIIMAYVELGLGVGILAPMAFDPDRDRGLRLLDASPIFGRMTAGLGLRPGYALTKSVYQVMQILVPQNFGSHSHSTAYPSSFFV
jgi:LysR family cys regulon transcriptional activator